MRLLIGAAVMATALAAGTLFQGRQASAEQAPPRIERPNERAATDMSARHRHYHHRRHRYYRTATLPYDGYRPYPPPPPCYRHCDYDLNLLPYFGRGW
ncbi:ribulose kinase [Nitrobacteraceae bacterium AZCC 1564]